jgi:hypothetical protein
MPVNPHKTARFANEDAPSYLLQATGRFGLPVADRNLPLALAFETPSAVPLSFKISFVIELREP